MKLVILAGGSGTRLIEESHLRPKPMIEIGGKPVIWHIMKIYSAHGINEFIVCCGYKGSQIKEYFSNYFLNLSDITIDLVSNKVDVHGGQAEPWKITLVDTGDETMTGGRIKRISRYLTKNESFCLTYGDGLSDINVSDLIDFHRSHGKQATLTAVRLPGRFGALEIDDTKCVKSFSEKPPGDGQLINGGFFVLEPSVLELIEGDHTIWERDPLEKLAEINQLKAFPHSGFWQAMDTLREKNYLEGLWNSGKAPWKVWK